MGNKDKTQDENAATSSEESRDTALARTIAQAVAESRRDQTYHRNFHKADGEDLGAV